MVEGDVIVVVARERERGKRDLDEEISRFDLVGDWIRTTSDLENRE